VKSNELQTVWASKKSSRGNEPLLLARSIKKDWLESTVGTQDIFFDGVLREALVDLQDSAKSQKKKNLPIAALRLMLQSNVEGVIAVDFNLGLKTGSSNLAIELMDLQVPEAELRDSIAATVTDWCINVLDIWAHANEFDTLAIRVRKAVNASCIGVISSTQTLKGARHDNIRFGLIARLIAEQLSSQSLFDGMGPCEIVISTDPGGRVVELMSPPRKPLSQAGGKNPFSMVAKVHVSTAPYTNAVFLSLSAAKRVWADKLPDGKNTGTTATAYVFSPEGIRIPVGMVCARSENGWKWTFTDAYASLVRDSNGVLPSTVEGALTMGPFVPGQWWIGIPQITRLYRRVDQHTVMEADEVALLETCMPMLSGIVDDTQFSVARRLVLNKQPQSAMLKLEDVGAAGASLYLDDPEEGDTSTSDTIDDDEMELDGHDIEPGKNMGLVDGDASVTAITVQEKMTLAEFRQQCTSVLNEAIGGSAATLWVIGGTPREQEIISKTAEVLFGHSVTVKTDPLPSGVHGMRADLPGSEFKSRQRFGARVQAWKESGLPQAIGAHAGAKFVMICAAKEIGRKSEDSVNRRAAIHAICETAKASVHHLLPMEEANTPQRKTKATQAFIHRCQSAMMDVMLAHSGYVIGAGKFVASQMGEANTPMYVYGIQALRVQAQRYTGEAPVSMAIYSRLNLFSNLTEVSYGYRDNSGTHRSTWAKLSSGLIWLGSQRNIISDEKWLQTEFTTMTVQVLSEAKELDPRAIVFVDWGTMTSLWKDLRDADLTAANPKIGHLDISKSFPLMSFVRIRYGKSAQIPLRSRSRATYEGYSEGVSPSSSGENYVDEYAVTVKQLVEISTDDKKPGRGHFVGVMSPRKTFQLKRGQSCYRNMPRMSSLSKVKGGAKAKGVFVKKWLEPLDKDASVPSSTDFTVFHSPADVDPAVIASIAMGLRVGYAHYNDWTMLPAPLFFARKIDDYIIKYPSAEDEVSADAVVDTAAQGVVESPPEADSTTNDDELIESQKLDIATSLIVSELSPEVRNENDDESISDAEPRSEDASSEETPVLEETVRPGRASWEIFDDILEMVIQPATEPGAANLHLNKEYTESLLDVVRNLDIIRLYPASNTGVRRMYTAMVRGQIKVVVEVPYFVNLRGMFGQYRPEMKNNVQNAWKSCQKLGYVAPNMPRPPLNEFLDWVAGKLRHPQGVCMISSRALSHSDFLLPKVGEIIKNVSATAQAKVGYERDGITLRIDLSQVVKTLLKAGDDESVAWLIFSSAQAPAFNFAASVMESLSSIPGPKTVAALIYYMQCHSAIAQVFREYGTSKGTIVINHRVGFIPLKDPGEIDEPTAQYALSNGSVDMDAAPLQQSMQPSAELRIDAFAQATANEVSSTETGSVPLSVGVFMEIKSSAITILQGLAMGTEEFASSVEQIRQMLVDMEALNEKHCKTLSSAATLEKFHQDVAKALAQTYAIDEDGAVKKYQYRAITEADLISARDPLRDLEMVVAIASAASVKMLSVLESQTAAPASKSEQIKRAVEIAKLANELTECLLTVDKRMSACSFLVASGDRPDGGLPLADVTLQQATSAPENIEVAISELDKTAEVTETTQNSWVPESVRILLDDEHSVPLAPVPRTPIGDVVSRIGAHSTTAKFYQPVPPVASTDPVPDGIKQVTTLAEPVCGAATAPVAAPVAKKENLVPQAIKVMVEATKPKEPALTEDPANTVVVLDASDTTDWTPQNARLEISYGHLKKLIVSRMYGLSGIYSAAIDQVFDDEIVHEHAVILGSLIASLDSIDCNFTVDSKLPAEFKLKLQSGLGPHGANATTLCRNIGVLGAGFVSAVFSNSGNEGGDDDALWTVLGVIRQPLTGLSSISALLDHIVSMKTKGVIPTREKMASSQIGGLMAVRAQIARDCKRAESWRNDHELHSNFNHRGFDKMHDHLYSLRHPIGQCIGFLASNDIKSLRQAFDAAQGKFRKPNATVAEAFKSIGERGKPDGRYAVLAAENIEITEKFISGFLEMSSSGSSASPAMPAHELEYLNELHQKLQLAIAEVNDINPALVLDGIYVRGAATVLTSVLRLFDDSAPAACIPISKQKLVVLVPMDRRLNPSMYDDEGTGQSAICSGEDVMDSIEDVSMEDLEDVESRANAPKMDAALAIAQRSHIEEGRFLPALLIDDLLQSKGPPKLEQPINVLFQRARADLSQKLQDARQRVTHAMALSALDQKDANRLLRIIEGIHTSNSAEKSIGHPNCASAAYPDFPHAKAALQNQVLKVLDARLNEAKDKLLQDLKEHEEKSGESSRVDVARIRKMLDTGNPASIRTAHDALAHLRAGNKLPSNIFDADRVPPTDFNNFIESLQAIRGRLVLLDALQQALSGEITDKSPDIIKSMNVAQRNEAAEFIQSWKDMCASRGSDAADMAGAFFAGIGIGAPSYMPESARRNAIAKLQFPDKAFSGFTNTDCFVPPSLGSMSRLVCGYVVPGAQPETELNALIQDVSSVPTFILSRANLTLARRAKISGQAPVILVDDNLIAYMAMHPEDRAKRLMEIGTLTFYTNPYSAEGTFVSREMFFGRQRELHSLREVKSLAILYGGRRLGKSSLLAQIEREEGNVPGSAAIYIPMDRDYAGSDHVLFAWRKLYSALLSRGVVSDMGASVTDWKKIREWVEHQLVAPSQQMRSCYLLFDEADKLMEHELELPDDTTGFVRSLQDMSENVNTKFTLRYVIAGLHNLARFTSESNSAFGKAKIIALEPFSSEDDIMRGVQLVTKPLAALGFFFGPGAEDLPLRILSICNFYPAFIQIYCRKLLDHMYNKRGNRDAYEFVKAEDLEKVERDHDLLHELQQKFAYTLDLDRRYRAIALILADYYYAEIESGKNEGLVVSDIRDFCEITVPKHFQGLSGAAYEGLLDEMRKLNVLEKNGSKYRLRNPSIAMLIGDRERIEFQLKAMASMPPEKARNHGDRRNELIAIGKSSVGPAPVFPMPVAWTHSQMETIDGSLIVLGGNNLCGLNEILSKQEWQLGQNDIYCAASLPASSVWAHVSRLRKQPTSHTSHSSFTTNLSKNNKLFLACTPNSWRATEISQFAALASKAAAPQVQVRLALVAHPDKLYELAKALRDGQVPLPNGADKRIDWTVASVPPWSADAIRFYLQDNVPVTEDPEALAAILTASCGFGREIQNICAGNLTVKSALLLPAKAKQSLAPNLDTFYNKIGWPKDVDVPLRYRMEQFLLHVHGELRDSANVADYLGTFGLDKFDMHFLTWMSLMQPAPDNTWFVPNLYRDLMQ